MAWIKRGAFWDLKRSRHVWGYNWLSAVLRRWGGVLVCAILETFNSLQRLSSLFNDCQKFSQPSSNRDFCSTQKMSLCCSEYQSACRVAMVGRRSSCLRQSGGYLRIPLHIKSLTTTQTSWISLLSAVHSQVSWSSGSTAWTSQKECFVQMIWWMRTAVSLVTSCIGHNPCCLPQISRCHYRPSHWRQRYRRWCCAVAEEYLSTRASCYRIRKQNSYSDWKKLHHYRKGVSSGFRSLANFDPTCVRLSV